MKPLKNIVFSTAVIPADAGIQSKNSSLLTAMLTVFILFAQGNIPAEVVETPEGRYEGAMLDGMRHGTGNMTYANGDYYRGGWLNDARHGTGNYTRRDGYMYHGKWWRGFMHGTGNMTVNGITLQGIWRHGELPYGNVTFSNEDSYQGKLYTSLRYGFMDARNGLTVMRHGIGNMSYANGEDYRGEWERDVRHGRGNYTWSDGTVFHGEWWDDERGRGEYSGEDPVYVIGLNLLNRAYYFLQDYFTEISVTVVAGIAVHELPLLYSFYSPYFRSPPVPTFGLDEFRCAVCLEEFTNRPALFFENVQRVRLAPCGHAQVCAACLANIQNCPLDQIAIAAAQNIYRFEVLMRWWLQFRR